MKEKKRRMTFLSLLRHASVRLRIGTNLSYCDKHQSSESEVSVMSGVMMKFGCVKTSVLDKNIKMMGDEEQL